VQTRDGGYLHDKRAERLYPCGRGSAPGQSRLGQGQGMGRWTIAIAFIALLLLGGFVAGYALYTRSEAYRSASPAATAMSSNESRR